VNADTANKWLTLAANIGVLIGIVLLLFELRQNTELVRVQVTQMRSDSFVQRRWDHADSQYMAPLIAKLQGQGFPRRVVERDELTEVELVRLEAWLAALAFDYENLYYQKRRGFIDQQYWDERVVPSLMMFGPYFEEYVVNLGREEFEEEVRALLQRQD